MVYSLDRDTPCQTLEKVPREELLAIASRVEALSAFPARSHDPLRHDGSSRRPGVRSQTVPIFRNSPAMQILISCAKTMTGTAAVAAPRTTRPLFEAEAAGLRPPAGRAARRGAGTERRA